MGEINKDTSSKTVWNKVRALQGKKSQSKIVLKDENQKLTADPNIISEILAKKFSS